MFKCLYVSEIYSVKQEQLNIFATASAGTGKIHTDPEYAKNTPFGKTLVHGLLLMGFIEKELNNRYKDWSSLGDLNITFIKPIKVNEHFQIFLEETENNLINIQLKKDGEDAIVGSAYMKS
ncbi:MaoC family dehydratase [Peribacillus sp. NPDC058002]|uniref:MaoC family dehydratase n=1 Tax=Peribacillus sp. NPDC058002 TaxID=3346301 RepID=UPI0036DCA933